MGRRRGPGLVPFLPVNEVVDSLALAGLGRRRGSILVSFLLVESVFRMMR
jgi:hypothetical protein